MAAREGGGGDERTDLRPSLNIRATPSSPPGPGEFGPGTRVGRYVVLKRLGRGGMSVVYMAYDEELDRRVALKLLKSDSPAQEQSGAATRRLLREAQAMARLSHPNVAAIFDVGTVDEEVFLAMEYVDGMTLREWRAARHPSIRDTIAAYVQAGRGLEAAHAAGILHRDFKPENVIVDSKGRAKVLDFGVARFDAAATIPDELALATTGVAAPLTSQAPLTYVGTLIGTPQYMSPEQLRGDRAEARSDQFAFCVALYEALYGERPFEGNTPQALLAAIKQGPRRLPRERPRISNRIRLAIVRGLSPNVESRWPSLTQLLAVLEKGISRRQHTLLFLVAAMLLSIAVAAGVVHERARPTHACANVAADIQETWGPSQKAAVADAFGASNSPRASETLARTVAALDGYAAQWSTMRIDSCEATRIRFEQSDEAFDLRTACLQQRRASLSSTVSLLEKADARLVDRAVDVVDGLPEIAECADIAHLRAPFSAPHDPLERSRVEAARVTLARARAADLAIHFDESERLSAAALSDARDLHNHQLEGEALLIMGDVSLKRGARDEARSRLVQAAIAASLARDDKTEAESWAELYFVAGTASQSGNANEVDVYERMAGAALDRAGNPLGSLGLFQANRGLVRQAHGDSSGAEQFFRDALAIRMREGRPQAIGASEAALGAELVDQGRAREALAHLQAATSALAKAYGDDDPRLASALIFSAASMIDLGQGQEALTTARRATLLAPKPNGQFAWSLLYVAEAQLLAGDRANAFDSASKAMIDFSSRASMYPDDVTQAHLEWAEVLLRRRFDEEALREAKAAVATDGSSDRHRAWALVALADARLRRVREALDAADRAQAGSEPPTSAGDRGELLPLLAIGEARLQAGQVQGALGALQQANGIAGTIEGPLEFVADARLALARAHRAAHEDDDGVRDLATRAATDYDASHLPEQAAAARALGSP